MMCRHCNHPQESHTRKEDRCRIQVLTGWDETQAKFTGHRACICPGYDGPALLPTLTCPHETQPQGDYPNRCVHCGVSVKSVQKGR